MAPTTIALRSSKPLLATRARHCVQGLVYARAVLYADRVRIHGWTWRGRFERVARLADIVSVDWWTLTADGPNIAVKTNNGGRLAFWVKSPGVWRFRIHEILTSAPETRQPERERFVSAA